MSWNYTVIAGSLLLLAFMIWKETGRQNRARLLWRLLATTLSVAALACLSLPVTYKTTRQTGRSRVAVILTEGYRTDSVKNFLRRFQAQPPVYSLVPNKDMLAPLQVTGLPADSLPLMAASFSEVHVFGYGFDREELDALQTESFFFHPAPLPAGIQSINWINRLKTGERLVVQGSCYNPLAAPLRILLNGLQAGLDSATIAPRSTGLFQLSSIPKLRGKALFSVTVLDGKDTIEQEPLPIETDTAAPVRVLMLASSPNFENKFLKDWLAKKGYAVEVRTLISTGKFNQLFANTTAQQPVKVAASLLQRTDVLISDPGALALLGQQEGAVLRSQVVEGGLGLIVRADSLLPRSFYAGAFPLVQTGDSVAKQMAVRTLGVVPDTASLLAELPLFIRPQPENQPLLAAGASGILAGIALAGSGKVIVTAIPNAYSWLLAGNERMYDAYWTLLLQKAARQQTAQGTWSFSPSLPATGEPVHLYSQTSDAPPPAGVISNTAAAYAQNRLLPFEWQASYWPKAGWQTAGSTHWYAYEAGNWKGVRALQKQGLTQRHVHQTGHPEKTGEKESLPGAPVPKIYFFIIFILSACFLWIEKKFS